MGKIMRNGKKYSGASSSMAENIIYDNTESGLEANDVQGAIDELNSKIDGSTTDNASPVYLTAISATWHTFMGFAIVNVAFGVGGVFDSTNGEVTINSVPITPKPIKNLYAPACSEHGTNTNSCTVKLDTDGFLKAIGKYTESSTTYYASFIFKLD